jgi:ELWxxDGT repeat protein
LPTAILAAALLGTHVAAADAQQQPYLVRDIETTGQPWYRNGCEVLCPPDLGSSPTRLTPFGERVVFTAFDFSGGDELWISDGTEQGTERLADLCPGQCAGDPSSYVVHRGELYFWNDDGLWRSDGAPGGAVFVGTPAAPTRRSGAPQGVVQIGTQLSFGNHLYFGWGSELWRTDGEEFELVTTGPDADDGFFIPMQLVAIGDEVFARWEGFFDERDVLQRVAPDVETVVEACAETFRELGDFAVLGDVLVFSAVCIDGEPEPRHGLFRSDGHPGGAVRLADTSGWVWGLTVVGARAFALVGPPDERRVWMTDGTAGGTLPLTPPLYEPRVAAGRASLLVAHGSPSTQLDVLDPVTGSLSPLLPAPIDSIFRLEPGLALIAAGDVMWRTDGTPAGTSVLFTGLDGLSHARDFVRAGGRVFFSADDGLHDRELWAAGLGVSVEIPTLSPAAAAALALLLAGLALLALRRAF